MSVIYSECVSVAVVFQHAVLMLRIELLSVASLAVPNFSTSFHKRNDFRKKIIDHKMGVLIFSTSSV